MLKVFFSNMIILATCGFCLTGMTQAFASEEDEGCMASQAVAPQIVSQINDGVDGNGLRCNYVNVLFFHTQAGLHCQLTPTYTAPNRKCYRAPIYLLECLKADGRHYAITKRFSREGNGYVYCNNSAPDDEGPYDPCTTWNKAFGLLGCH